MTRAGRIFTAVNWKYAVGEILLIVIGILLAVQINNWNSDRIFRINERTILSRLKNDLISNQQNITRRSEINKERLKMTEEIYDLLEKHMTYEEMINAVCPARMDFPFNPVQSTFEEMKNTGLIYRLSNDSIRNQVINYYRELNETTELLNKQNSYINEMWLLPNFLKLRENCILTFYGEVPEKEMEWLNNKEGESLQSYKSFVLYYRVVITTDDYYTDLLNSLNEEALELFTEF